MQNLQKVTIEKIERETKLCKDELEREFITVKVKDGRFYKGFGNELNATYKEGDEVELELIEREWEGKTQYDFKDDYSKLPQEPMIKDLEIGKYIPTNVRFIKIGTGKFGEWHLYIFNIDGKDYKHFASTRDKDTIQASDVTGFEIEVKPYLGRTDEEKNEAQSIIDEAVANGVPIPTAVKLASRGKKSVWINSLTSKL